MNRTPQQVVDLANAIARSNYMVMGYVVREGYRFDRARHPQEQQCWRMACQAFDLIDGTDVVGAVEELEDEEAAAS